ncbi:MAG TPA: PAS domain S-box protein [Bryobacteraceae bacterium]|nr:PAS domain S-box protein [Bryobacteraceae bacterium]
MAALTIDVSATGILESMSDGFLALDRQWRYTFVNRAAEQITGHRREEMLGRTVSEIPLPGASFETACRRALNEGVIVHVEEYFTTVATWFDVNVYPAADGIAVHAHDISKRKKAEQRLAFHAHLLENVHDAIIAVDEHFLVTAWNRAAEEMYGWKEEEVLGRDARQVVRSEMDSARRHELQRRLAESGPSPFETIHHRRDGVPINVEGSVMALRNASGRISGYVATHRDITARRQVEEALRTREAQLKEAQRLAHLGSWQWEIATNTVTWSDELYRIWGVNPQEFERTYPAVLGLVHPDDRQVVDQVIQKTYRDHVPYELEHRIIRPDGTVRILQSRGAVVVDDAGNAVRLVGTGQDMTERKQAEEELRAKEHFIRKITELSPVVLDVYDLVTKRHRWFSSDTVGLFGYTPDEMLRLSEGFPLVHPEDMPRLRDSLARVERLRDGEVSEFECRVRRRDGEWRWIGSRTVVFARAESGEVRQLVNAAVDVTERKLTEQALQRAHEELEQRVLERTAEIAATNQKLRDEAEERQSFERELRRVQAYLAEGQRLTHTGSWAWNVATGELYWSDEQFRIFGLDPEQSPPSISGVLQLIHPDDRSFVAQAFDSVLHDRNGSEWECGIVTRDGRMRHIHTTIRPVFESGQLIEYVGTTMDVTDRKRAEEERQRLLRRLLVAQEEERRRIARDMHDDLTQRVTLLAIQMDTLRLNPPEERAQVSADITSLTRQVVALADEIRRFSHRLHPSVLEDLGLEAALRRLTHDLEVAYGMTVHITADPLSRPVPLETATALYRIAQEALRNAARHAPGAGVIVRLSGNGLQLRLSVHDDGPGFDAEAARTTGGLGVLSMQERSEAVGGRFILRSTPGSGTDIQVIVPWPEQ